MRVLSRWFVFLGLLLGALYALFTAPLGVPDEGGHMYRAYLVSEGFCTAVPAVGIPVDYRELDRRVIWRQLSPKSTGRDLLNLVDDAHGSPLEVVALFNGINVYSCLPYLPAGAAFRAGRFFTDSPLSLLYLGRFANLFFYLFLVVIAMRILPEFQLPLVVLALMPMSLQQAASLSADAVSMGVSFVIAAHILRLAMAPGAAALQRADYILLVVCVVVAGLCKSNAGLMFLLLLIPAARFGGRWKWGLSIAGCIVLAYGIAVAWQYVNGPNVEIRATLKAAAGIYPNENAALIVQRPVVFLSAVGRTVLGMAHEYLEEFVGKLGALSIHLPGWIPWVYLALLILVAVANRAGSILSRGQRLLLVGIFLLNMGSLFAVFWTTEISRNFMATEIAPGRGRIDGVQGRYAISFAPLLLIAMSGLIGRWKFPIAGRAWPRGMAALSALAVVAIVNTVALTVVWNRVQAHSSTIPNRIRMALKLQFGHTSETAAFLYDNLAVSGRTPGSAAFLVAEGTRHLAPNQAALTFRGFRWPDDVLLVSDQELAAIPLGAPMPRPDDYEGRLVRRPGSSPEDGKVYLVHDGQKHWVWDARWIASHGYKWPDDVKTIAASDLAQIPEGPQIP